MAGPVWKILIDEETSAEGLERPILEAEHTSDVNVQRVAAQAIVEKERRANETEAAKLRLRVGELEGELAEAKPSVRWTKAGVIAACSGWAAFALMLIIWRSGK